MPNKTFRDFTLIGKDEAQQNSDLKPTGTEEVYLVGYKLTPATEDSAESASEIRIEIEDHIKKTASYYENKNISSDVVEFVSESSTGGSASPRSQTLTEKLNNLLSTEDYVSSNNTSETAAGQVAKYKRLFVGDSKTATLRVAPVGADFTSIQEALQAISKWHIESDSLVIIRVESDIEVTSPIVLNHPQGERIHILGSLKTGGSYTQVNISTTGFGENESANFDLFKITDGHRLGLIDQLDLIGVPAAYNNGWGSLDSKAAIRASRHAYINVGANVKISNWYYGLLAEYGSTINASQYVNGSQVGIVVNNCGFAGICATHGSHVTAVGATVTNTKLLGGYGYGIIAQHGSQIICDRATVYLNDRAGVASFSGSEVSALGAVSYNNGSSSRAVNGSGFFASDGGFIDASNIVINGQTFTTQSYNNYGYGFEYLKGGSISGNTGNSNDNTLGLTNKFALSTTKNSVAALESNDETLHLFTTRGRQVEIKSPTSDSTSRLVLVGGTSTELPAVEVAGVDSNIDLKLSAKGNGRIILGENVSFGEVQNFTSLNPSPIEGITQYITITDSSNQTRKLLIV